MQTGAKLEAGGIAQVMTKRENKPCALNIPSAIRKMLAANADAQAVFDRLPCSHRREYLRWLTSAKKPATLERRLREFVRRLLSRQSAQR